MIIFETSIHKKPIPIYYIILSQSSKEAVNTNFIILLGLMQKWIQPITLPHANHYITEIRGYYFKLHLASNHNPSKKASTGCPGRIQYTTRPSVMTQMILSTGCLSRLTLDQKGNSLIILLGIDHHWRSKIKKCTSNAINKLDLSTGSSLYHF